MISLFQMALGEGKTKTALKKAELLKKTEIGVR